MVQKKRVLMVCLGNICRSPIAEAVFKNEINVLGLNESWEVESAAIIGYHTGKCPDPRAMSTLREKGITNYSHTARTVNTDDFTTFNWIFGMDNSNIEELNNMKPANCTAKIELLGKYDPKGEIIIKDPYYMNNNNGFYKAYEQSTRCIKAFLQQHKDESLKPE
ncbi:low molecular weight phosphotyrosine protein phosphatase-like isoform X2 [Bombus pyrosoma]|uniref:low molecular weight phosphotyrosine protein phosphatase-like isoform X2 n=1 Tax=Bombus pyrosoma TaxID=396416 RepID=UPI001CB8F012|nr:low molecular weight phosphotyrosine protein phosphatase-like isoform X2 [Bombus pyrosoma]XP_043605154.1 low molecular weight phosphotyrosine protein phosphatase-like isoform X2 [Bombus pyrosoma]XP_043605155.1 low molecular weight phosphotyrosine protein phosphatase-like isoform X2 [Bombus pyrosoma]